MKVFIITRMPFPNGMAATNRIKCYAKAIIEQGISCQVLIFTRTEVYGKPPKNTIGEGEIEGIPYKYIGGTPLRGSNIFVRQFDDFHDKLKLIHFLKQNLETGDVVFGYCGACVRYINLLIDIIHHKKAKYIRDLCELPYGTTKETQKAVYYRRITLKKQIPKCDGIITISEALKDLADHYKGGKTKIIKIPIMVDFDKYEMDDRSNESTVPYIFHSGTLYEQKDGILGMIEAFGITCKKYKKEIKFISTGNIESSPHSNQIKELIKKYSLEDKIKFTGYLNHNELKQYLAKATLVIINKYNTKQNKYCFSTKLAEYLAAGKVVILTNVGEAINWLKDNESAYIVETEDCEKLADKIIYALENKSQSLKIAKNGKAVCRQYFSYKQYGKTLVDLFINK